MNTEERQLAEMLHRVTPEPPRRVTVEDVAFRLASEPERGPRSRRGFSFRGVFGAGRGWTPVLAALSVFAIAGASAGIATVATSHHSRSGAPSDGTPPATASVSGSPSPTSQTQNPAGQPLRAPLPQDCRTIRGEESARVHRPARRSMFFRVQTLYEKITSNAKTWFRAQAVHQSGR